MNFFFKIAKFISLGFIVLVSITLLFLFFANKSENNIHKINDSFILETLPKVFKLELVKFTYFYLSHGNHRGLPKNKYHNNAGKDEKIAPTIKSKGKSVSALFNPIIKINPTIQKR